MANPDARVSDGFTVLTGGMNGGVAATLIGQDQVSFASDVTFRGGYARTREPWVNLPLTFDTTTTQTNFTGTFQGAAWYQSEFGQSGFVISRGGRLFLLTLGLTNVISEITPMATVVTTQPFTVPPAIVFPNPASQVQVFITDSAPFIGYSGPMYLDGGSYTVASAGAGYLILNYFSGAQDAICPVGAVALDSNHVPIVTSETNPANFDFIHLFQAENYMITLAGQNNPVIYDGSLARQAVPGEIPPGMFGIYLWGRIWVVLPNRKNFVAGDLVGSSSGSPGLAFVDAILKMTENTFLNGGGQFSTPANRGKITSMAELAVVDTSLGTGNLLVGTAKGVFSVNTPVDRTTWQNLSYPIQTVSLLNYGPVGPRFTCDSNNDLWFRARDGVRSYKNARREMNEDGNTPQSQEISNILDHDDPTMLFYGSSILFGNRLYFTVSPYRDVNGNGVAHRGMAVMNLDTVSNLRGKAPAQWEGVYTGLNVLQLAVADINEADRAFAFALNGNSVELWELGAASNYDAFNNGTTVTRTAIQPVLETRAFNCGDGDQLKKLLTARIYLDKLVDNVTLVIKYRPDQHPQWTAWSTVNVCANVSQCSIQPADPTGKCTVLQMNKKQYAVAIQLPQPTNVDNALTQRPMSFGYEHQIRIEATGNFRLRGLKIECQPQSEPSTGTPKSGTCPTVAGCDPPIFTYDSHG